MLFKYISKSRNHKKEKLIQMYRYFFKNRDKYSKLNKSGKLRTSNKNNLKYCNMYKIRRLVTIHFRSYKSVIELFWRIIWKPILDYTPLGCNLLIIKLTDIFPYDIIW